MRAFPCLPPASTILVAIMLSSCSDASPTKPACTPGVSQACTGKGGCMGGQVCNAKGTAFDACLCGDADAGSGQGTGVADAGEKSRVDAAMAAGHDASVLGKHDAGQADAGHTDAGTDASTGFGPFVCNPITQAPCSSKQRCAWVAQSGQAGTLSCVSDGTVAQDNACVKNSSGLDNCKRGLVCISAKCAKACDLTDSTSCSPPAGYCAEYSGLYSVGNKPALAGACVPGCNPVTQLTIKGTACAGGQGCYLVMADTSTTATCHQPGTLTQDMAITGTAYINSCAPGFVKIGDKDGNPICTALCTPVETYSGSTANIGGAAPHTCADRGAGAGFECRFGAIFSNMYPPDPLLDTIGICVNPAGRLYDANNTGTASTPWPSCANLANTDTDADGVPDNQKWGCAPATH